MLTFKVTTVGASAGFILTKEAKRAPDDPGLDRVLRAAVKYDIVTELVSRL